MLVIFTPNIEFPTETQISLSAMWRARCSCSAHALIRYARSPCNLTRCRCVKLLVAQITPILFKKISFLAIPNPLTDRERCARWITNIGTNKFDIKTYEYSKYRKVCEDHFEPDMRAKVMGYEPTRKLLKPDGCCANAFRSSSQTCATSSNQTENQGI